MKWTAQGVHIAGTGIARPERVPGFRAWTSRDLLADLGLPLDLEHRSASASRARVEAPTDGVDLGAAALTDALTLADLPGEAIEVLVFATSTSSRATASDAHRLADRVGCQGAAWDVRSGGAAGLHAWAQAAQAIAQGARVAVAVVSEVITPYLDPADGLANLAYGDAAAAVVLTRGAGTLAAFRAGHLPPTGRGFTVPDPMPPRPGASFRATRPDATWTAVLDAAWVHATSTLAADAGGPVDVLLPYAVSRAQLDRVRAAVPARHTVHALDHHGCVGAASPIVALHLARSHDQRLGAVAVGGGLSWATLLWEPG